MRFYIKAKTSPKHIRVTDLIQTGWQKQLVKLPTRDAACTEASANCWHVRVAGYPPKDEVGNVKIEWSADGQEPFKLFVPNKDVTEGETVTVDDVEYEGASKGASKSAMARTPARKKPAKKKS
jgi:hypothetical protein